MKKEENNSFENIIRDKINNLDLPYNNEAWPQLEKDISGIFPKAKFSSMKIASIVTAIVIVSVVTYFITKPDSNKQNSIVTAEVVETAGAENDTELNAPNLISTKESKTVTTSTNISPSKEIDNKGQETTLKEHSDGKAKIEEKFAEVERGEDTNNENLITESNLIPSSRFSISDLQVCTGQEIVFTPLEISDSINYVWDFGDGVVSNQRIAKHVYTVDGEYFVSLETKYTESKTSSYFIVDDPIIVFPTPSADFSFEKEINTYHFKLKQSCDNVVWKINTEQISTKLLADYTFLKTGAYQVSCLTENEYGCSDSKSENLDVQIEHNIPMPNAFSPDGDGLNDVFGPPAEFCYDYTVSFKIFDKSGILLFTTNDVNKKWDGANHYSNKTMDSGVYIWILVTKDKYGNVQSKKGTVNLIR